MVPDIFPTNIFPNTEYFSYRFFPTPKAPHVPNAQLLAVARQSTFKAEAILQQVPCVGETKAVLVQGVVPARLVLQTALFVTVVRLSKQLLCKKRKA